MDQLFTTVSTYFVPHSCDTLFEAACVKTFLSRCLSLLLMFGAMSIYVPQILKIYRAQSGAGLSLPSTVLQLLTVTFGVMYGIARGYTFSSWGDTAFVCVQLIVIVCQIFHYSHQNTRLMLFLSIYGVVVAFFLSPFVPIEVHKTLQSANILILIYGRFLQVKANYDNQSTGHLSAITTTQIVLGLFVKSYIVMQETGDLLMATTFVSAWFMNAIILYQIFYYAPKADKKTE